MRQAAGGESLPLMASTHIHGSRLGAIRDEQFAAAVGKAGLGTFLSAAPTTSGLFGQNVFLTTTQGDYVFRGAPHWHNGRPNDAWQFPKERFYADLLHAQTPVPVAWPQMLDDSCEDFPWPYLITPRLPGLCLQDPAARKGLTRQDFVQVARAMGAALAGLQVLTWNFAGDFDPDLQALGPYPSGYAGHLAQEIINHSEATRPNGTLSPEDDQWLAMLLRADAEAAQDPAASFVHNDYTLGNVLFERSAEGWRVSGVIDLMTSCFGDPAADLVRQTCAWIDAGPACAAAFLTAYRQAGGRATPTRARLAAVAAYERLMIWGYFTRPDVADPRFTGLTYRAWAEPYVQRLAALWFAG